MAITIENIKLMASQRLTDFDDGGGYMSATEIVDGNVNNLFPNISRLASTYGKVRLREVFAFIDTDDAETYSGAHVAIIAPAKDPYVGVCAFQLPEGKYSRTDAVDYIESYVTVGPAFQGWLMGDQPAGSRSLLLYTMAGVPLPDVGSVFCLFNDKDDPGEEFQYVRVTKAEAEMRTFVDKDGEYQRQVMNVDIGTPLRIKFIGRDVARIDTTATSIYTTMVSDAAKYYGCMKPANAYAVGDINLKVDSIYAHLVPSAQAETPMVDLTPGEAGPVFGSGTTFTRSLPNQNFGSGTTIYVGRAIVPGSLVISRPSATPNEYTDNGDGVLMAGSTQVGVINYGMGSATMQGTSDHTTTASLTCQVGVEVPMLPNSTLTPVEISSRGYNWTKILEPAPKPGTLVVDYMALGQWYRLRDNGKGELIPDTDGAGTGTVNHITGSVVLTCGALPDIDSVILWSWGNPIECIDIAGIVEPDLPEITHTLQNSPVEPGSLTIDWITGLDDQGQAITATLIDDGNGNLTGDGEGWINHATGKIGFKPAFLPAVGEDYSLEYEKYIPTSGVFSVSGTGVVSFNLPVQNIKPGSLSLSLSVVVQGVSAVYSFRDNGSGVISASARSVSAGGESADRTEGDIKLPAINGTVDYVAGGGSITMSSAVESWHELSIETSGSFVGSTTSGNGRKYLSRTITIKSDNSAVRSVSASGGTFSCALNTGSSAVADESLAPPNYKLNILPSAGYTIQEGSVMFRYAGSIYIDRLGKLYKDPDIATGQGVEAGTIDYSSGDATLTAAGGADTASLEIISLVARMGKQLSASITFRTPGAPLRPGSVNFVGTIVDGSPLSLSCDFDGTINGAGGRGIANFDTGVIHIEFGKWVAASPDIVDSPWYDEDDVVDGQIFKPIPGMADSMLYGCVIYSYLPLDAKLIGIDPVRLPTDGRVPICKPADTVIIHNSINESLPTSIDAGTTITLAREPDDLILYDSAEVPLRVPSTMFERVGDEITMTETFDPTDYTLPIIAQNRIEDMALVTDADITGFITIVQGLSHDYPVENTYVSSAVLFDDLQARLTGMFDQETWRDNWVDHLEGDGCIASYNEIAYPPTVTNAGTVTERWALIFDSADHFKIVAESRGVVGDGYITNDVAPINPGSGKPYFLLQFEGFGSGWSAGNVIRFRTIGSAPPFWIARTTLQGKVGTGKDNFIMQLRGGAA